MESELSWGLWVVLELEWSPRTPPAKSCRDRSSSHQPHPLLFLSLSLCNSPISIFSFFLAFAAASFIPSSPFPSFWPLHQLLSRFQRRMPCLFFFCISSVMNISLSCCNMIAWQQASLCNAEHLFGVINKIVVF